MYDESLLAWKTFNRATVESYEVVEDNFWVSTTLGLTRILLNGVEKNLLKNPF